MNDKEANKDEKISLLKKRIKELERSEIKREQAEEIILTQAEVTKNMAEGAYIIGLHDAIIRWASPRFENMFGYEPGEMIGRHVSIVNAPTDKSPEERAEEIMDVIRRTGEWHGEVNNIQKDGTPFWCYASVSVFTHHEYGEVLLSVHTDITERKQAEEVLRASEARLNEAQHLAQIGNWELDLVTNNLFWSDEVYRMFDLQPQQFGATYEAFLENIHPDDKAFVDKAYTESLKNKKPYDIVHRLLLKDGKIRFVNERCETFYDDAGKAIRSIGTVQDITERKQAEKALIELSLRNEAILSAVPDIIMEVDVKKVYTWANKPGIEFFGEDVLGKEAAYYFEGEQETYDVVQPLFLGAEEVVYIESWQRRKDGKKRLLAWWCRTLKDADRNVTGALSTARDITEQKQTEKDLKERQ